MASVSELLFIASLCLSGSVFGFPLHKNTEQTCGYEVGLMFVSLLMTEYQIRGLVWKLVRVINLSTWFCHYSTDFWTLSCRS